MVVLCVESFYIIASKWMLYFNTFAMTVEVESDDGDAFLFGSSSLPYLSNAIKSY